MRLDGPINCPEYQAPLPEYLSIVTTTPEWAAPFKPKHDDAKHEEKLQYVYLRPGIPVVKPNDLKELCDRWGTFYRLPGMAPWMYSLPGLESYHWLYHYNDESDCLWCGI